jgi:hypothetical protein
VWAIGTVHDRELVVQHLLLRSVSIWVRELRAWMTSHTVR